MKNIIFIVFGICAFVSCKKDTTKYGPPPSENIYPSNATSYYAIFTTQKNDFLYPPLFSIQTFYNEDAYFSSTPVVNSIFSTAITVDSVKLNGVLFGRYPGATSYSDTNSATSKYNYMPAIWHVVGNNGIPSFTYTNYGIMPAYTGYNLLPDTIDHTKGLTLTISNISNSNSNSITVGDSSGHGVYKYLAQGSNSITFSAAVMAQLSSTRSGYVSITCTKNNIQDVYGKAMNFQSVYSLQKQIFIK